MLLEKVPLPATATFADDVLPLFLSRCRSENTRRAYRNDLEEFFALFFEDGRLSTENVRRVTFAHVNLYIEHLKRTGCAENTLRRKISSISSFFRWAEAVELVARSPVVRLLVQLPRASKERHIVTLSREEARRLLEAARAHPRTGIRDEALVRVLLYCWLRRSEAAAMNFEHIRKIGAHYVLRLPQTKKGTEEIVKIPPHCMTALQRLATFYGEARGPVWRSFSNNSRGRRLSAQSIYNIVARLAREIGLDRRIGAHTLRHTGITLAVQGGAPLHKVRSQARHADIQTTMVYVHQQDFLDDNAADYVHL